MRRRSANSGVGVDECEQSPNVFSVINQIKKIGKLNGLMALMTITLCFFQGMAVPDAVAAAYYDAYPESSKVDLDFTSNIVLAGTDDEVSSPALWLYAASAGSRKLASGMSNCQVKMNLIFDPEDTIAAITRGGEALSPLRVMQRATFLKAVPKLQRLYAELTVYIVSRRGRLVTAGTSSHRYADAGLATKVGDRYRPHALLGVPVSFVALTYSLYVYGLAFGMIGLAYFRADCA